MTSSSAAVRWFPDLLATKWGRLTAFFALYITEGIPLGFAATAVATQMRRQGVGPAEIGAFVAMFYVPWSFKWAAGPFVDVIASDRLGRRRGWILLTQLMMVTTLLVSMTVDFVGQIRLFTIILLVHNAFAATQDVAIDALAVNVLKPEERGMANGLMFGGAYLGQALGGAGVLFLTPWMGFQPTFFVVSGWILLVTLFITLPMREPKLPRDPAPPGSALWAVFTQIAGFVRGSLRAMLGTRKAFLGLVFAALPGGAYALGLALQSNLAVELGLTDPQVATLNLWSTLISGGACVLGGWISDRFGRLKTLALFFIGTAIPTFALAMVMQQHGWIHPIPTTAPDRPIPAATLVQFFWVSVLTYSVFQGLFYGVRTALFMDLTNPKVAATQFTAYMALLNAVIAYSAWWQGQALERWGYPVTLVADSILGLICISLMPFLKTERRKADAQAGQAVPEAVSP